MIGGWHRIKISVLYYILSDLRSQEKNYKKLTKSLIALYIMDNCIFLTGTHTHNVCTDNLITVLAYLTFIQTVDQQVKYPIRSSVLQCIQRGYDMCRHVFIRIMYRTTTRKPKVSQEKYQEINDIRQECAKSNCETKCHIEEILQVLDQHDVDAEYCPKKKQERITSAYSRCIKTNTDHEEYLYINLSLAQTRGWHD